MTNAELTFAPVAENDDGLIRRTFDAEVKAGDGRTIDVRIVPFGKRALAADGKGGKPKGQPYEEEWLPGCFDRQMEVAHRVLLDLEHESVLRSLGHAVGKGVSLREDRDGLYGSFKVFDDPVGDRALMLVREGVMTAVSLAAKPLKSVQRADGVIARVKGHLDSVGLCRQGAYDDAVVLAVRTDELIPELESELLPIEPDYAVLARCREFGIALPQRYQAHLDEADTSAEADTSELDTRQTESTSTSEEA